MASAPIKILFAIPELDRGGPDRVMFEVLSALDRTRFAPALVVSEPTGYYLSRLPGDVTVEVLGGGRGLRDRYPVLAALRVIRRLKPDVVFATQRMILTLGVASLAFPRATRLIVRQANDVTADFAALIEQSMVKHRLSRMVSLASFRRADAIVCQSTAMQNDLGKLLGQRSKLHVISNPIDVDVVSRVGAPHSPLPGRPALVSVGRLSAQKGFDLLLPAIAEARTRHPDLHLTILGDGPDRAALEALSRQLGLERSVTFAGFVADPLASVRAADLFVLASRYEGFPNAALEALACGTPIVLTDCPGANSEIVLPGTNGRLAAKAEPGAFAQALDLALRELAAYDRTAIQADCRQRFSSQRIVHAYEHMITTVVHA
ncbi:MAG: glycosyltransferase [Deltaproteobacteria bacterium]|nr:glycosyltransferase [Deltaproteobacteria bacterium]